MIKAGSRYEFSLVDFYSVEAGASKNPVVFYDFSELGYVTYDTHKYIAGERLDSIAQKYYRRPGLWWLIAEFNPEVDDFENIPNGTILRIPSV